MERLACPKLVLTVLLLIMVSANSGHAYFNVTVGGLPLRDFMDDNPYQNVDCKISPVIKKLKVGDLQLPQIMCECGQQCWGREGTCTQLFQWITLPSGLSPVKWYRGCVCIYNERKTQVQN